MSDGRARGANDVFRDALCRERDDLRTRLTTAERELAEARAETTRLGQEWMATAARIRDERDSADTTRREWEVRAATSYAAGRAAGLREAAGVCMELGGNALSIAWVNAADECERRIRALAPPAAVVCTGLTATWCPNCGDCVCPRTHGENEPSLDDARCPLHAPNSAHPDAPPAAETVRDFVDGNPPKAERRNGTPAAETEVDRG